MNIKPYKIQLLSDNRIRIETSGASVETGIPETALSFLLNRDEDQLSVVWNVDEFISVLLRLFPETELKKLQKRRKCFVRPFSVYYLNNKTFSVKQASRKGFNGFYSLDQYFPEVDDEPEDLQSYCDQLDKALTIMKQSHTRTLVSPIGIYKSCMFKHLTLPNYRQIAPKEVLLGDKGSDGLAVYALNCSSKLWIENYKIGYFEKIWDYDMVSCFPTIAAELYDMSKFNWERSELFYPEAFYGYCKGIIRINKNVKLHPFIYKRTEADGNLHSYTPVGTWETYLTKAEIDFLYKWKLGEFELIDGWFGFPKKSGLSQPYRKPIADLMKWKNHKNKLVSRLGKLQANGLYGVQGEWRDTEEGEVPGPHANFLVFAEISSRARLHVADWIYRHKLVNNVVYISVDGVATDREVENELET